MAPPRGASPRWTATSCTRIAGNASGLWVGRQQGGLTHLADVGGRFVARTYRVADGLPQNSVFAVMTARDGSIWAGTLSGGVSHLANGRFTTYTTADGLPSNSVSAIAEDAEGIVWLGTPAGLSRFSSGRWTTFGEREGLPSLEVNALYAESNVVWVGTSAGLASIVANTVQVPRTTPAVLKQPVHGMATIGIGWLWVATASHVLRVSRAALLSGEVGAADVREYGLADGLRSVETMKRQPSVVADGHGRIWFSLSRSLSVVDPRRVIERVAPGDRAHARCFRRRDSDEDERVRAAPASIAAAAHHVQLRRPQPGRARADPLPLSPRRVRQRLE